MEPVPEDELPVKQKRSRKMTPELLAKLADARKKAAEIKKQMAGNVPAKVQHAKEKIKKERQHSKKHIKKLAEDELDKESNLVNTATNEILEKEDEATPKEPDPDPEESQTEVAEATDPVPEEKVAKPKKSKKPVIIEESSDEEEVVYVKKRIVKKKRQKNSRTRYTSTVSRKNRTRRTTYA